jgi:hypothetical protein
MQTITDAEKRILRLFPSVSVLLFIFLFWESLFFMPQMMNADGDLGRHITVGAHILDTGQIPTRDIFSHTMTGAPLVPHEWLSQLLFALAHRVAGLNGVAWLTALVLASAYALLAQSIRAAGVRALIALAGGFFASIVGAVHALTRPHIFTLLFFTLFVVIIERYRRDGNWRALIPLPFLTIIWANTHGAFISGLVLIIFSALGAALERNRRQVIQLLALLVVALLATFINPVGATLAQHSFSYLQQRFLVDVTTEYQSPDFHNIATMPFAALLLLALALGWRRNRELGWRALVPIAGWIAFALYSARNIPLAAQVVVLLLAPEADAWIAENIRALNGFLARSDQMDRMASGWIWALVAIALLVSAQASGVKLDAWERGNAFDARVFPVAAADALAQSPPDGAMFNEFNWGGYLLYRLYPHQRVFIDGQTDFYGEALSREYLDVVNGAPGWEKILARYNARWIIVGPQRALAAQLDQSPEWMRRYADATAVVWVRR